VQGVLTDHNAALVWADRKGRPISPLWRTADFGYLRLHEGAAKIWPFYGRRSLVTWAERITSAFDDGDDVFVYFNNDPHCAAVDNAVTFGRALQAAGAATTRFPAHRPETGYSST
jgi:uncharacterized protein YecE (DUF72 family)